jgi:hypothetical protein
MEQRAPDLYEELKQLSFLILKGDLNYRKLVGDREWNPTTEFRKALMGFAPTTFLALRTLKAETVAGISQEILQSLENKFGGDKTWMVSSEYAVAQLFER